MDQHPTLPGAARLEAFRVKRGFSRAALAQFISDNGGHAVDRVTVVNLLDGRAQRVSVIVASAIAKATKIPVSAWLPVESDHAANDTAARTGTGE